MAGTEDEAAGVMEEEQKTLESQNVQAVAHDWSKKIRSSDVIVEGKDSDVDFHGLQLTEPIVRGLHNCGFQKPSPIQLRAIPLGRLGFGKRNNPIIPPQNRFEQFWCHWKAITE